MNTLTPSLVSVIIPAFNAAKWISQTVSSVLTQTYDRLQIIIIDDGSTDNTKAIVESFCDKRITYIHTENLGGCAARNKGLMAARGNYIQYLDADDLLSTDKIERQVRLLESSPANCVAVCGVVYFEDGTEPTNGTPSPGYPELNSDSPIDWLSELWTPGPGYGSTRWGMVPLHSWLTPRSVADLAGPWAENLTIDQDGEYFCRIVLSSAGIRWEPSSQTYYRKFPTRSSVSVCTSSKITSLLKAVDSKVAALDTRLHGAFSEKTRRAIARQYMNVAFHGLPFAPAVAYRAWRKATMVGGYNACEFLDYSPQGRALAKVIGWPLTKCIITGTYSLRKLFSK